MTMMVQHKLRSTESRRLNGVPSPSDCDGGNDDHVADVSSYSLTWNPGEGGGDSGSLALTGTAVCCLQDFVLAEVPVVYVHL